MSNTVQEKVFRIMSERLRPMDPIPLRVILPHVNTAYQNHHQSLGRLNERGGLHPKEALHVLLDLRWDGSEASQRIQYMTTEEADKEVRAIVHERFPKILAEDALIRERMRGRCTHDEPEKLINAQGIRKCPHCGCLVAL